MFRRTRLAVHRAASGIRAIAIVTVIGTVTGMLMVHAGNRFAVGHADKIVAKAHASSPITRAYREKRLVTAAALDFAGNLTAGTATMLAGYYPPPVYAIVAYRAWIGGIVSLDRSHGSRLADPREAAYYLTVLVLQLIPYILLAGAGVTLGRARVRPVDHYSGPRVLGVPTEALKDAASIWVLCAPIFAIASAVEFLWPR
jgi:hypothetical protein